MTKIEEIARAIANAGGEYPDRIVGGKPLWVFHVSQARAAVEALRVPNYAMVLAGTADTPSANCASFNAMLDVVLADSP
jgi:hypothetical protein